MTEVNLTVGTRKFLDLNKATLESFKQMSIKEQREAIRKINQEKEKTEVPDVEEWRVEWKERKVPIRIYRPIIEDHVPIVLYFHGGGWVLGDIETRDQFCRRITSFAECIVIAVDYKLAPDYTYPEALKDGVAVVEWLLADEHRLWNLRKIVVSGDSAGANIANGVTLSFNQSKPEIKIHHQVLICPIVDFTRFDRDSYIKFANGYFLEKWMMETYRYCYLTEQEEENHPLISPILTKSFEDLPPTTLITAEYDILHDEGKEYALILMENGVPVDYHEFERMIHGFIVLGEIDPEAEKNITKLLVIIKSNIW